jgi:hypothetical protein
LEKEALWLAEIATKTMLVSDKVNADAWRGDITRKVHGKTLSWKRSHWTSISV